MLKQAQNICQVQSDDDDKSIRALFGIKGYVSLDKNKGQGHNTLLLRLIPGDLYSACPQSFTHYVYMAF